MVDVSEHLLLIIAHPVGQVLIVILLLLNPLRLEQEHNGMHGFCYLNFQKQAMAMDGILN